MAAGEGFKTWNTGDVLSANDVNGYLMQGIWVFDDAADRTAQVTAPAEGNFSYLRDTNKLYYYTGSAWAEADTSGILPSEFTAKGDLLAGTGSGTFDNLTVGANGTVLTADSSTATGLAWVAGGASEGPAISVYRTTDQTVTQNTYTKIQFTSENFDTDNTFNTSDYKFTPNKSGKYLVQLCIIGSGTQNYGVLYKNGTRIKGIGQNTNGATANGSTIISMNGTTDYLEFYAYLTTGTTITGTDEYTYASACYLRS